MATTKLALAFLLLLSFRHVSAQPSFGSDDDASRYHYTTSFSPGVAVLIVILVVFFFLIIFFSLYINRRSVAPTTISPFPTAATPASRAGLDPIIIDSFPTLAYSEVMQLKTNKDALECAVCLNEFSEDESLRMLPKCCHVFHPECIGGWLAGHKTCPVCRADLSVVDPAAEEVPLSVDITKIGRSNTIAVADRFTLRVPEKVRREIVMMRSASVAAVVGKEEGSSRRGRPERWGSLVRTLSMWRTRDAGEGTSEGTRRERMVEFFSGKRRLSFKEGSSDHPSSSAVGADDHV